MFNFLKRAATSAESAIVRGFDSIGDRLAAVGDHLLQAIEHPFAPPDLKVGIPMLLDVIDDLHQEVAELRKPCPCDQAAASTTGQAGDAAPLPPAASPILATVANAPVQVDLTTKWPRYGDALAAFNAGEMNADEVAAFQQLQAKVDAFAASVAASSAHG